MTPVDVVCLCDRTNLKKTFGAHAPAVAPWLRLRDPDEIEDPSAIEFALAWKPTTGAFTPYPSLRLVTSVGAGADSILACRDLPRDVIVSRIIDPEQAAQMAGFALWHVIGHDRQLLAYPTLQAEARWHQITKQPPSRFPVGVLGYGLMGRTIADLLNRLGYPVLALARTRPDALPDNTQVLTGDDGLLQVASESRALINTLPLTDETRGILNARLFAAMREDALLIQIGRGEHLVETDLIDALDANQLAGAALDVFEREPLDAAHPFWRHPKIRITPHVASEPDDRNVVRWLGAEIERVRQGKSALGAIDRSRGY